MLYLEQLEDRVTPGTMTKPEPVTAPEPGSIPSLDQLSYEGKVATLKGQSLILQYNQTQLQNWQDGLSTAYWYGTVWLGGAVISSYLYGQKIDYWSAEVEKSNDVIYYLWDQVKPEDRP